MTVAHRHTEHETAPPAPVLAPAPDVAEAAPVPAAPMPMAAAGAPQLLRMTDDRAGASAGAEADDALARLRPRGQATVRRRMFGNLFDDPNDPPARVPANLEPRTLDELLALTDQHIRLLSRMTTADGPLKDVLMGAFEGDWFRAKACLVFDKWPGEHEPVFGHEASLALMTGLTSFRGAVHERVMPLAQKQVREELVVRARQLKGRQELAATLARESDKDGKSQIEYKGSVGADTVTSDVDVSTGGANSELGVRAYNQAFRRYMGTEFDPGTVFDLNVYAMDFIHGKTDSADKLSFTTKSENAEEPEAADAANRDREQDIWAMVHVARYMPDDKEWDDYVHDTIAGIRDPKQYDEQKSRMDTARSRAKGFEERLVGMMVHLESDLKLTEKQLDGSEWSDDDNRHHLQGALRMRAANKLYEDKLLQVKEMRTQISELRTAITKKQAGADPERLKLLVSRLSGELSMAQLYANEVYGSGGATVHAVMGMQTKKKLSAERGHDVKAIIPVQEWYQAFTDNLGDVLKDFEHYGKGHGEHGADHWYAAFKMGKYADRMVDALPHLVEGGMITQADGAKLAGDPNVVALRTLSTNHVKEKSGPSKDDPAKLQGHPYFGTMDAAKLLGLRSAALDLGLKVRQMVAIAQVPKIVDPSTTPAPEAAPKAPAPTSRDPRFSAVVNDTLAYMVARAQDALEDVEEESQEFTE